MNCPTLLSMKLNRMWTCIECEHEYDESTGDVDERMCNECLDDEYVEPLETNLITLRVNRDDYSHYDKELQSINLSDRSRENKINNEDEQ